MGATNGSLGRAAVRPRLLAVMAHPDDESFGLGGLLALYAARGVEVHICTVTDGAAGVYANDEVAAHGQTLAEQRREELECACRVLGAELHTLGYRDSGMAGTADNFHPQSLYQANLDDVALDVACVIRRVRPHVVVTHDPTGGYFHPDHIKVNQATVEAFERAADPAGYPCLAAEGLGHWQPQRLYYHVIPRSQLRWLLRFLRLTRRDATRFGQNHDVDLTRVGVPDGQIQMRIPVSSMSEVKRKASACHRSQGGGGLASWLPRVMLQLANRYDHLIQAYPQTSRKSNDLFDTVLVEE